MMALLLPFAGMIGIPQRFQKIASIIMEIVIVLGLLWLGLHLYGKHRYNEGVAATDAKWQVAVEKLQQDAKQSATKADDAAAQRTATQLVKHTKDQEAVNAAVKNGTSPLDALFGN